MGVDRLREVSVSGDPTVDSVGLYFVKINGAVQFRYKGIVLSLLFSTGALVPEVFLNFSSRRERAAKLTRGTIKKNFRDQGTQQAIVASMA